jgi:hypothetical protein
MIRLKTRTWLGERFIHEAEQARETAAQLPPGAHREMLLTKARHADLMARIEEWDVPGLQPPT